MTGSETIGQRSIRKLPTGVFVTPAFVRTSTSYSVPVPDAAFLALLDSESYATDNAAYKEGGQTLYDRLKPTVAMGVDYNGHFGAQIILELDFDDDTPENREEIVAIINEHLTWCMTLPLRPDVAKRRKEGAV